MGRDFPIPGERGKTASGGHSSPGIAHSRSEERRGDVGVLRILGQSPSLSFLPLAKVTWQDSHLLLCTLSGRG